MVYMIELGLEGAQFISFCDGSCRVLGLQGFARAPVHLLSSFISCWWLLLLLSLFSVVWRVFASTALAYRTRVSIGLGFVDDLWEEDRDLPRAMQCRGSYWARASSKMVSQSSPDMGPGFIDCEYDVDVAHFDKWVHWRSFKTLGSGLTRPTLKNID